MKRNRAMRVRGSGEDVLLARDDFEKDVLSARDDFEKDD